VTTTILPILRVVDVERASSWWARLGFVTQFTHQFEPGLPHYRGMQREDAWVHLSEHTGDAAGPGLVYLWVEDVDALAAEFGAAVEQMPWARDFEVTDPDGNRVRVATGIDEPGG
jgi:catechol 2,3-dioxygenase-like lactoylglutathione lyase family enzyme